MSRVSGLAKIPPLRQKGSDELGFNLESCICDLHHYLGHLLDIHSATSSCTTNLNEEVKRGHVRASESLEEDLQGVIAFLATAFELASSE